MINTDEYTFLYPKAKTWAFDEVCRQIVLELEKRNWDVDGIEVKFDTRGTGAKKYRLVRYISGEDFKLWFCRTQGRLSRNLNDTAAIHQIIIPNHDFSVNDDESGPRYYLYVGNNWEDDKYAFMHHLKVHSKLDGKPRTYLPYSGQMHGQLLVHNNDLGREYDPIGDEPTSILTSEVVNEITAWLKANVLAPIRKAPKGQAAQVAESIPYPENLAPFYTFGKYKDGRRIVVGQNNPQDLEPADRYGMQGNGYRLLSWDIPRGDLPELVHDGFLWCLFGDLPQGVNIDRLPDHIGWQSRWREDDHVIGIYPKTANDIYVVDLGAADDYRDQCFAKTDRLSTEQLIHVYHLIGATLIPITEYKNGYNKPTVLVNRELSLDEVKVLSGPALDD